MLGWRALILLVVVSGTQACREKEAAEVSMACSWVVYGRELDSFVFNLDRREVYWVNEDKRYPVTELTEGRIGFVGVRSEVRLGLQEVARDATIKYSINRVTGQLYLEGVDVPPGFVDDNVCVITSKIL